MNWIDILLGALGGGALVTLLTLPSIIKKAKAEAKAADMENIGKAMQAWRDLADERQEANKDRDDRIRELNAKIDELYETIATQRNGNDELRKENTRLQVKMASDEVKLCYVRGCANREPQSGY